MKIQLDTEKKIIRLESNVNIYEFIKTIQKLLPNNEWKEFTLETGSIINWQSPIIIKEKEFWPINPFTPSYPISPTTYPPWYVTCEHNSGLNINSNQLTLTPGTFNIEC